MTSRHFLALKSYNGSTTIIPTQSTYDFFILPHIMFVPTKKKTEKRSKNNHYHMIIVTQQALACLMLVKVRSQSEW
jgi:hypothetical protein